MTSMNVPSDGNCLLHSIALAFLDPTSDEKEFQRRFQLLFGSGFEEECDNLYQQFLVNAIDKNLYKQITSNQKWETLIDKFRFNLAKFMETQSHVLSNSVNAVGYIPNNNNFYNTASFDKYLEIISMPGVWLGSLEILAASLLLECCISVLQQSTLMATFNKQSNLILSLEYLIERKHYNFILKYSPIPRHERKLPISESEFNAAHDSDLDNLTIKIKKPKLYNDTQKYDSSVSGLKRALHGPHDIETYSNNTILHLVTHRDQPNIINFLICHFRNYKIDYFKKILMATNRSNLTVLEVAHINKNITCFRILLNLCGLYCKESLRYNLVSIFQKYFRILDNEKIENDHIIFKELVLYAKREVHVESFKKLLLTPIRTTYSPKYGQEGTCNTLHIMVSFRQKSNLELLFNELQNFSIVLKLLILGKETCGDGLTPFYLARRKNYSEIITLFITALKTNPRLFSCMMLPLDNEVIALQKKDLLQNPKVVEFLIETLEQNINPCDYQRIIRNLVVNCNSQKETIFSVAFNQNADKKAIIFLLNKLDLQTLCEDIVLLSIYLKDMSLNSRYKFMDWFQSGIIESTHNENPIVSDIITKTKEKIPIVMEETKKITSSVPDMRNSIFKADQQFRDQLISKEILLTYEVNLFTLILDLVSYMHSLKSITQKHVLNYLSNYSHILRAIVLQTDALGCTILHRLTVQNKKEQIKLIQNHLKNFPDIIKDLKLKLNGNEERKLTPLAVANKNKEILEIILNHNVSNETLVDIIFKVNRDKRSIFEIAIGQRAEDIVKLILSYINSLKNDYTVDLMFGTYKHTENIVVYCFKTSSPLISTLLLNYILEHLEINKIKRLFLGANYSPTINLDDYGNLNFAIAQQNEFLNMDLLFTYIKLVFKISTDCKEYVLTSNENNHNFLHIASSLGSYKNIEYYLEGLLNFSDLETVVSLLLDQNNSSKMTPLHYAVFHNEPDSLQMLLSFCKKRLIYLYPNLIRQLLLVKETSGCTLLTLAVETNSPECFTLLLSMAKFMEQNQAPILQDLLAATNWEGRTVLHDIILEEQTDMLNELLETLEICPTLIDELVTMEDKYGETILHARLFEDDVENIKMIMRKLRDKNTLLKILTKENRYGLTPLHKAYFHSEPNSSTDINVKFLLDLMAQRNLIGETFSKLERVSNVSQQLENAIMGENLEEINTILYVCHDCPRELFLMGAPGTSRFVEAAYNTNNVDIVKSFLEFLKGESNLLKCFFLANLIQFPANFCDFEILSLLLDYAKGMQDTDCYIHVLLESNVILVLKNKNGNKKTRNLFKEETNKIAVSIIEGKLQLHSIGFNYLMNLKHYVESNEYTGPSQDELVNIVKTEIYRRDCIGEYC